MRTITRCARLARPCARAGSMTISCGGPRCSGLAIVLTCRVHLLDRPLPNRSVMPRFAHRCADDERAAALGVVLLVLRRKARSRLTAVARCSSRWLTDPEHTAADGSRGLGCFRSGDSGHSLRLSGRVGAALSAEQGIECVVLGQASMLAQAALGSGVPVLVSPDSSCSSPRASRGQRASADQGLLQGACFREAELRNGRHVLVMRHRVVADVRLTKMPRATRLRSALAGPLGHIRERYVLSGRMSGGKPRPAQTDAGGEISPSEPPSIRLAGLRRNWRWNCAPAGAETASSASRMP